MVPVVPVAAGLVPDLPGLVPNLPAPSSRVPEWLIAVLNMLRKLQNVYLMVLAATIQYGRTCCTKFWLYRFDCIFGTSKVRHVWHPLVLCRLPDVPDVLD